MFGQRILANFKEAPGMGAEILIGHIHKIVGDEKRRVIKKGDELEISFHYPPRKETCIFVCTDPNAASKALKGFIALALELKDTSEVKGEFILSHSQLTFFNPNLEQKKEKVDGKTLFMDSGDVSVIHFL